MNVAVLTVDQRDSRRNRDLVPETLEALAAFPALLPFERTAGDEIQAVFTDPKAVVDCLELLVRAGSWNIGVGIGEISEPLPDHTRAGHGPAYLHAREAVTSSKQAPARLRVVGDDDYRADQLETVLWLWADLLGRRTDRGWEVADLIRAGLSHAEAGAKLGISQSAVSQRARAASVIEADRASRLATQLLDAALTEGDA